MEVTYADIEAGQKAMLIESSIAFMRSVTEIWGSEKGMELWGSITDTLDPDLKGDIFFGMVSGKYTPSSVLIKQIGTTNYVGVIKAVRTISGMGLKEAKDFCDYIRSTGPKALDIPSASQSARSDFIRELISLGVTVA